MSFLHRLLSVEIPPLPERQRPWLTAYVAIHAVAYAVIFVATVHFVFLGPGLPDEITYRHVLDLLEQTLDLGTSSGSHLGLMALGALVLSTTVLRGWIVYRGYAEYPQGMGDAVPLDEAAALVLVNLLNILFAPVLLWLLAGVAGSLGFAPARGWSALASLVSAANGLVARVPTVVHLPRPLAFLCTIMGITFLHYWLHRLSHNRRLLWLLLHRPHHLTQHLCYGTTLPVFMAFPLFLLVAFPYTFLFGAMARLFWPTPMYAEMIVLQLAISVGEIYGHSPALYERGIRQPWVRWLSFINCQGVYHVLHHSASMAIVRGGSNNTVNMGSGPFSCWDLLFGTFHPLIEKPPPLGLLGQPRLYLNPLRLLLSGVLQLAWELQHNLSLRSWWSILLGPCTYSPPVTRDFAVHEQEQPAMTGPEMPGESALVMGMTAR